MLKLLRARFAPNPGDEPYTPEEAIAEYHELAKMWDNQRSRKQHAMHRWVCFSCEKKYPAEGFNAASNKREEINQCCIRPGHWRSCVACTAVISLGQSDRNSIMLTCNTCGVTRSTNFFEPSSTECFVCSLSAEFAEEPQETPCATSKDITCSICKQN